MFFPTSKFITHSLPPRRQLTAQHAIAAASDLFGAAAGFFTLANLCEVPPNASESGRKPGDASNSNNDYNGPPQSAEQADPRDAQPEGNNSEAPQANSDNAVSASATQHVPAAVVVSAVPAGLRPITWVAARSMLAPAN